MDHIWQLICDLLASPYQAPLPRILDDFLRNQYFIVFWSLTFVAFVVRRPWVRRAYLVFFFCSMFVVGLVGVKLLLAWPFHHWHLWARHLQLRQEFEFHEVGVEDASGRFLRYDCRAAYPLIPEILRMRFASQMLYGENGEVMAQWLLNKARTYQPKPSLISWMEFPLRTPGPRWPSDHGQFTTLVVQRKHVKLGPTPEESEFTLIAEKKFR